MLTLSHLPPPEVPSGGMQARVSTSNVADPTGDQATATVDVGLWGEHQAALRGEIAGARQAVAAMYCRVSQMAAMLPRHEVERAVDEDEACRQGCGDPKAAGRQGNCEACAKWLRDHLYPDGTKRGEVPTDVLARREKMRGARKVHVTGPLAGDDVEAVA